jgi:hypothetical protein
MNNGMTTFKTVSSAGSLFDPKKKLLHQVKENS